MSPLVVYAIKILLATGALAAAGRLIASKLPAVNVHTPSAKLNQIIDTVGNAAENVVKAELQGDLLTQVASAIANGQAIAGPLASQLPALVSAVETQIGPAIVAALGEALGSDDAAQKRLTTEILVAAHDHATESLNLKTTLASGRVLVQEA